MKRFLQFSAIILMSCSSLTPASAQDLDANGQKLKSMFKTIIDNQTKNPLSELNTLSFDGDVNVEQSGKYYAVTLPYMTLNYPDGAKFDIGMVAINAAPHDDPDQWKMTFALPTPMTFTNKDGVKSMQMSIGSQGASGVWNDALGYFSKLDANYQDVMMTDPDQSHVVSIPSLRAVYDLESDENGKWSGPTYFTLEDLSINVPEEGGEVLRVGNISMNIEMFKYDPSSMKGYQAKLEKLLIKQENGEKVEPQDVNASEMIDTFIDIIGDGFTSQYQIKDVTLKGGKTNENFDTIKLAEAGLGFDLTGFMSNRVALGLRMGYQGFEMQPPPAGVADIAPKNMNLDITLQNIPFQEIADMGKNSAEAALANPDMAQMAGMSVLFKLPALLSEAGTSLVLTNNHFGNDAYNVKIDGKVVTDLQAANSATADITGAIKGLDNLSKILTEELNKTPANPNASFIQQILMGLTMAKGFGEIGTNENGEPVHQYKFIMNQQGQMLLNGQDMSMFTGGVKAPAASPE